MSGAADKGNTFIVHIGAHRTGTTSVQTLLDKHRDHLAENKVQALTPMILRGRSRLVNIGSGKKGNAPKLAKATHSWNLVQSLLEEDQRVILSEENILGSMRASVQKGQIYPNLSQRLQNMTPILQNASTIILVVRKELDWWNSTIAFDAKKRALPSEDQLEKIAENSLGWERVMVEICKKFPEVCLKILPYRASPNENLHQLWDAFGISEIQDISAEKIATNKSPKITKLSDHQDNSRLQRAVLDDGRGFNFFNTFAAEKFHIRDQRFVDVLQTAALSNVQVDIEAFETW